MHGGISCKHLHPPPPPQPLTPLELVQAARKAHGESVEVGTEEDLWGPPGGIPRSDEEEDGETPNVVRVRSSLYIAGGSPL